MIDAIAAYKYLICNMGFLPQNITVGGDSAGGSIALAVTRYVVESNLPHLPPPGGLIAACPAADLSHSRAGINSSHYLNASCDMFDHKPNSHAPSVLRPSRASYFGDIGLEEAKRNRYLSPASEFATPLKVGDTKLFSGFPRSYIMGGGAEFQYDDIAALAERMMDDGVDVTADFHPDAVHDYFVFSWHEPERTQSLTRCAAWLDEGRDVAAVVVE